MDYSFNDAKKILKKYFGYPNFREPQIPIIKSIIEKRENSLVIMPTGGGKSILYTIPALLYNGLTLVISPLIALMEDQVLQLKENGIEAEYISYERGNFEKIKADIKTIKILFVSPERFVSDNFINWLKTIDLSFIALDEAHTFTEFGLKFRTDYRLLFEKLINFKNIQFLAVTATVSETIYEDLTTNYQFDNIFSYPVFRNNLKIDIKYFKTISQRDEAIFGGLEENNISLIYTSSRSRTERVFHLNRFKFKKIAYYHAKLPSERKKEVLKGFLTEDYKIISATTAFGMGINKANVRKIHHIDLPLSIEDYTQQIGRAGRDGELSDVILWISFEEIITRFENLINDDYFTSFNQIIEKIQQKKEINSMYDKYLNILKLNKVIEEKEVKVEVVLLEKTHKLLLLNDFLNSLKEYQQNSNDKDIKITMNKLSKIINEPIWIVKDILNYLQFRKKIDFKIDSYNIIELNSEKLKTIAKNFKLEEIKRFLTTLEYIFTPQCRHRWLATFFRTKNLDSCKTICDNCLQNYDNKIKNSNPYKNILKNIPHNKKINIIKLLSSFKDSDSLREKITLLIYKGYEFRVIDNKLFLSL